jgi:hypothetical protein
MARFYKAADGKLYPVKDAKYNSVLTPTRTDNDCAEPGNAFACVIAKNAMRTIPGLVEAYVGSGSAVYLVYGATLDEPAHAVRFCISASAGKVRDAFDDDKTIKRQTVVLLAPRPSHTLAGRATYEAGKRRSVATGEKIKKPVSGSRPYKAQRRASPPLVHVADRTGKKQRELELA